jgi:hypothetical protein
MDVLETVMAALIRYVQARAVASPVPNDESSPVQSDELSAALLDPKPNIRAELKAVSSTGTGGSAAAPADRFHPQSSPLF